MLDQHDYDGPDETSTADRIRAFEDKHVGPDALRHNGKLEDGHGSPFASLSPAHKAHHAALHKLLATEQHAAVTAAAAGQAEQALAAAQEAADRTETEIPETE